ncbi:MAG: carboxymuconolactone decarboxylase family protein [Microscillaceae bacterium]
MSTNQRLEPLSPPYEEETAALLASRMPPGVPPLVLFRAMAHNPRIAEKMKNGNLLDRGSITLREREIVINRTTALCKSEYEWGVHIAFFAEKAKFSREEITSLTFGQAKDAIWNEAERALIQASDELHQFANLSDETWAALSHHFSPSQIIEIIAIAGYYHTISFMTNALHLPNEAFGAKFSDYAP